MSEGYVSIKKARPRFPTGLLAVLVAGVLVLTICLTWAYLSMRAVMDVGGSCADGGPYVSAQPCPSGAGFIGIAIPVGLLAAFAATIAAVNLAAPNLGLLAWAALFGSLGWNFFDYGLSGGPGGGAGFIVCGVVFWLMALPGLLVTVIPRFSNFGSSSGGARQNSAVWWGIYAALAVIGVFLGAWSFHSWR